MKKVFKASLLILTIGLGVLCLGYMRDIFDMEDAIKVFGSIVVIVLVYWVISAITTDTPISEK